MKPLGERWRWRTATAAETRLRRRYEAYRRLLADNRAALRHMAALEQLYRQEENPSFGAFEQHCQALTTHVGNMIGALAELAPTEAAALVARHAALHDEIMQGLAPAPADRSLPLVLPLEAVDPAHMPGVGGKALQLALLKNQLRLPVPAGFVITATAFHRFLETSGVSAQIRAELARLGTDDLAALAAASEAITASLMASALPAELADALDAAIARLMASAPKGVGLAVRSSAVGEDGAASFAGQYATALNVPPAALATAYKRVVASKYSPRALAYRRQQGLRDEETPMAVLVLAMVEARSSGVLYTRDPSRPEAASLIVSALWGLGEPLVGGAASADVFEIDRAQGDLRAQRLARKTTRLVPAPTGGLESQAVPPELQDQPSLSRSELAELIAGAHAIEATTGCPQDIEWAIDHAGQLYFLQTRPLQLPQRRQLLPELDYAGLDNLIATACVAAPGIAIGPVFRAAHEAALAQMPDQAILVVPNAAPGYAAVIHRCSGLICAVGSPTSHLASVAREYGIPAVMAAGDIAERLTDGETVTLVALNEAGLFRGAVDRFRPHLHPPRRRFLGSPAQQRLRRLLDRIVPLHLTDRRAPDFSADACRSLHDIIRYCHETATRAMFSLAATAEGTGATRRVRTALPFSLYVVDLGGGLSHAAGLRGDLSPTALASAPMQAIWQGLTHPAIPWQGTVNFAQSGFLTLMASLATAELGPAPGGDSYAVIAHDYMNFSARFGYHFATIDALCTDDDTHNYVSLHFAGGAGHFLGRALRIRFLAEVLGRIGFVCETGGDFIEAHFARHGRTATLAALDQLGRLLASCRLLDLTLTDEAAVAECVTAFLAGHYDFLERQTRPPVPHFHTQLGHWSLETCDGLPCLHQAGKAPSASLTQRLGHALGVSYRAMLGSLGIREYFPLAIARDITCERGRLSVVLKLSGGYAERAAGLVCGYRNAAHYYVFGIDALEHEAVLIEFIEGEPQRRAHVALPIACERWYELTIDLDGQALRCHLDGQRLFEHPLVTPLHGALGVWTVADSEVWFKPLRLTSEGELRELAY